VIEVARADELWDGDLVGRRVAGHKVLLVRVEGVVRAYVDRCPHLGVELSQGALQGCVLTCHAHHYQYDVRTGRGVNPEGVQLTPLPVRVEDGRVLVELPPGDGR